MDYRVSFFKVGRKENKETGKLESTGQDDFLGAVTVSDDASKSSSTSLMALAFRIAPDKCSNADRVKIERK